MGSFDQRHRPRQADATILNLSDHLVMSRRSALGGLTGGVLALGLGLPTAATAQTAPGASKFATSVSAFLEIRPDGSFHLLSPFVEGGQGVDIGVVQIIAEELDADPARFTVSCAPVAEPYNIMFGDTMRLTGGSLSIRSSFETFRKLGATARAMLIASAATQWGTPAAGLTTSLGFVVNASAGKSLSYGELAAAAAKLAAPTEVALKSPADFKVIGQPVRRLDSRAKSTGAAHYTIDARVDGMLQAAILHAPRLGQEPQLITNEATLLAMPGVHSVHRLPGAVAVVADRWWRAKTAIEAITVTWTGDGVPADFSSAGQLAVFKAAASTPGVAAENHGDAAAILAASSRLSEAEYDAPYLAHAQLEPPSALAQFASDGTLDLIVPNQAPDFYRLAAAAVAGLKPEQVRIHSRILGGFFGRHFLYGPANVFPQAILLAKATGRPVKVIWSREEEFRRDAYRPLSYAKFRASLGTDGMPSAIHAIAVGEGPLGRHLPGFLRNPAIDDSVVEGLSEKPYAVPNRRVDYIKSAHPGNVGFWRSVGHSMNDFFFEAFLDELATAAGRDPFDYRMALLTDKPRHATLLRAVAELSGGWKRGPYDAVDGTKRARGVAMASPFGSETATIAEVSIKGRQVAVHHLWIAIDPGRVVNPAVIAAQVRSAAAIGLSSALIEEFVFKNGQPEAVNYDAYQILTPDLMPQISVRVVESGAPMGGVGEPGTPGVSPAVVNAAAVLTGKRVRSLPLAKTDMSKA